MDISENVSRSSYKNSFDDARLYLRAMLDGDTEAAQLYALTRVSGPLVDEAWVQNAGFKFICCFPEVKATTELFHEMRTFIRKNKKALSQIADNPNIQYGGSTSSSLVTALKNSAHIFRGVELDFIDSMWPQIPVKYLSEHFEHIKQVLNNPDSFEQEGNTLLVSTFSATGAFIDDYFSVKCCFPKPEEKMAIIERMIPSYDSHPKSSSHSGFETFDEMVKTFFEDPFIVDLNYAFETFGEIIKEHGGSVAELGSAALKYARNPTERNEEAITTKLENRYLQLNVSTSGNSESNKSTRNNTSVLDIVRQETKNTIVNLLKTLYPDRVDNQVNQIASDLTKLHTKMGVDLPWLLNRIELLRNQSESPRDLLSACTAAAKAYKPSPIQNQPLKLVNIESAKSLSEALLLLSGANNFKEINWQTLEGLMDPDEPVGRLSEALGYLVLHRLSQNGKSIKRLNFLGQLSELPFPNLLPGVLNDLYAKMQIITLAGAISTSENDQVQLNSNLKSKFLD